MSSRLTRYGAVAAVAAVIILGLTLIEGKDKKAGKAWAIEQTIRALQNVRAVYFSGVLNTTHELSSGVPEGKVVPVPFEIWARMDGPAGGQDAYFDTRTVGQIMVKHDNIVYRYHPGPNIVYLQDGSTFTAMDPWPGPDYFRNVKAEATTWQEDYGKDDTTGRDSAFVKCTGEHGSYWLQFDVESKLPVRAKCWHNNKNWEGEPTVVMERVVYNPEIPDDKFEFKIPPGAKVIDERKQVKKDQGKE